MFFSSVSFGDCCDLEGNVQ